MADKTPSCSSCGRLKKGDVKFLKLGDGHQLCPDCHSNIPLCCSCQRFNLKPGHYNFFKLGDGRQLCSYCYSSAVVDSDSCKPLIHSLREFYQTCFDLYISENNEYLFVDQQEMTKIQEITNPKINKIPTAITIRSDSYANSIKTIKRCRKCENGIKVEKGKYRCKYGIRVAVLFGYSDVVMGGVLAREMMKAWFLRLNKDDDRCKLERSVVKGVCDVMPKMWVEWYCSADAVKEAELVRRNKLKELYFQQNAESFDNDIYRGIKSHGFKGLLNYIVVKGSLPPPPRKENDHAMNAHRYYGDSYTSAVVIHEQQWRAKYGYGGAQPVQVLHSSGGNDGGAFYLLGGAAVLLSLWIYLMLRR